MPTNLPRRRARRESRSFSLLALAVLISVALGSGSVGHPVITLTKKVGRGESAIGEGKA
jgi:hypothetical protein